MMLFSSVPDSVLIELCRIEIQEADCRLQKRLVLIELCRIEIIRT